MNRDQQRAQRALEAVGFTRSYRNAFASHQLGDTTVEVKPCRTICLVFWRNKLRNVGNGPVYVGPFRGRGWAAYGAKVAKAVATNGRCAEENDVLLHALGRSSGGALGWRNYFNAAFNSHCEALVEAGLMEVAAPAVYRVTDAGKRAVGVDVG